MPTNTRKSVARHRHECKCKTQVQEAKAPNGLKITTKYAQKKHWKGPIRKTGKNRQSGKGYIFSHTDLLYFNAHWIFYCTNFQRFFFENMSKVNCNSYVWSYHFIQGGVLKTYNELQSLKQKCYSKCLGYCWYGWYGVASYFIWD